MNEFAGIDNSLNPRARACEQRYTRIISIRRYCPALLPYLDDNSLRSCIPCKYAITVHAWHTQVNARVIKFNRVKSQRGDIRSGMKRKEEGKKAILGEKRRSIRWGEKKGLNLRAQARPRAVQSRSFCTPIVSEGPLLRSPFMTVLSDERYPTWYQIHGSYTGARGAISAFSARALSIARDFAFHCFITAAHLCNTNVIRTTVICHVQNGMLTPGFLQFLTVCRYRIARPKRKRTLVTCDLP